MSVETFGGTIIKITTAEETGVGGTLDPVAVVRVEDFDVNVPLDSYHNYKQDENVLVIVRKGTFANNGEAYTFHNLEHNSNPK